MNQKEKKEFDNPSFDDTDNVGVGPQNAREEPTPGPPEQDQDYRYGWGPFKPRWLRGLANIKVFVLLTMLLCLAEGFAVNGIANAALVHLEKQFGLRSTESALISSSQDFGALVVVLFVSFLGARSSIPRWVAVGALSMAVGSFLFIVPHLATTASPEVVGPPPSGLCEQQSDSSSSMQPPGPPVDSSGNLSPFYGVFILANVLHGMGFSPVFTLATAYIDDHEEHTLAAVYVGMTYASAALGVALGFFVGGQISEKFYVDFDKVDQSKLTFGPRDPQWVGAWWVGFIPACGVFLLLAPFLYAFPKSLPSVCRSNDALHAAGGNKCYKASQVDKPADTSSGSVIKVTVFMFLRAFKRLLLNPTFVLLCLGAAAETLIISGVTSFAFKYLTEQFSMTFDEAGQILAGLIVVGGAGMLGGGVIIRLLKLEAVGMSRLLAILTLMAALLGCAILAHCPETRLAGQDTPYPGDSSVDGYLSSCQGSCQCNGVSFNPVCGEDSRVYFSPCHAGCLQESNPGPSSTYHNCSCVAQAQNVSAAEDGARADRGRCAQSCDNRKIFLPCLFLMFLAVLLTTTPNSMTCLRVVDQDIRPFALGCQWMLIRLLGTIPGPPLVGLVLDRTCLVWRRAPDGSQFCALYSKQQMSSGIFVWWIVVNLLGTIFYLAASCLINRKKRTLQFDEE